MLVCQRTYIYDSFMYILSPSCTILLYHSYTDIISRQSVSWRHSGVTDTTTLVWSTNETSQIYFTPLNQVNQAAHTLGIFSLQFLATTGGFKSTATVHNVSLYQNGANITCSDNANDESGSKTRSIMIREPHPNFVMYYIMKVMHNPQKQSHLHPSN